MINNRQGGRRGRGRNNNGARPQGGAPRQDGGGSRIDNRSRGNANQLHEKYKTLARDVQMQGDRVMTEYYLQFADHYFRILNETRQRFEEQRRPREDGYQQGAYASELDYENEGEEDYPGDERIVARDQRPPERQPDRQPERAPERGDEGQRQPRYERQPREFDERGPREDRFEREPRGERQARGERPNRPAGDEDGRGDRTRRERANGGGRRDQVNGNVPEAPANGVVANGVDGNREVEALPAAPAEDQFDLTALPPSLALSIPTRGDEGDGPAEPDAPRRRRRRTKAEMEAARAAAAQGDVAA